VKLHVERSRIPECEAVAGGLAEIYSKHDSNHQIIQDAWAILLALNDRRRIVVMQTGVKRAKPVTLVVELLLAKTKKEDNHA
jgi:hypothetical protein